MPRPDPPHAPMPFACLPAELKLVLALLLRRYSVTARDPRLLAKATWFPGPTPAAGTDVMDLTPVPV